MCANYLSFENTACAGCGQIIAARTIVNALAPNVIIANATGCLEITTGAQPKSAWGVPWIHSLFANPASVASGIAAALRAKQDKQTKILVQAGDGSTFDIGLAAVSGMWSRHESIIYVCYDNEVYANTGMQASAATLKGSNTVTTPAQGINLGFQSHKKDMVAIALAHGLSYVAQTTAAHLDDLKAKIAYAASIDGPSYIQVLTACIPGWAVAAKDSVNLTKLAADCGLYPLLEFKDGRNTTTWRVPQPSVMVADYLKSQKRYKHLFDSAEGLAVVAELQAQADYNIEKYKLKPAD